jgi:AraC-like DNA-binding protein/mannose-6-phosphate isomerase-like protein (cupin superfamily)
MAAASLLPTGARPFTLGASPESEVSMQTRNHRARHGIESKNRTSAVPRRGDPARRVELVGTAVEFSAGKLKVQRCYGTFAEDMPDQSFRFNILFVEHNGAFSMHAHEYSELVIVLGGRGLHLTDRENYPIEEGDVFVISGNTRHGFEGARDLQLCNIQYDPQQFLRGHRALDRMMGYHALFDLEPRAQLDGYFNERLHLSTEEMVYVTSLLATLKSEFQTREEGWEIFIKSTFLLLVSYFSRRYAMHKKGHATPLVRMANVIAHIQRHFREPLRIEDLARIAHLSPSQFQRLFKQTYHTTPQKFVRHVRLHEACEMLKDPNRDITTVAFNSGFSSSSFFSTQFKQHVGESPSQYRRRKNIELENQDGRRVWIVGASDARGGPPRATLA